MRIDLDTTIPAGWREICGVLEDAGHDVFLVGGCVRDSILGRPIADVDLATTADAGEILGTAAAAGLRTVPTGVKYGSISVFASCNQFTVTSFRRDLDSDGRHPSIAFSDDISEDAARRDFTMNAIYSTPEGEIIDPLDGMGDLLAGRVRFIGEPSDRLREDCLRMLRFFRFHIHYGGDGVELDGDGLAAVRSMVDGVGRLSRERIGQELLRMLDARESSRGVLPMEKVGLLERILPGSTANALPILERIESKLGIDPDALRRLALLGGGDMAKSVRLSRKIARRVETLFRAKSGSETPSTLGYRLGERLAVDAMLLRGAERGVELESDFQAIAANAARRKFPVAAKDLTSDFSGSDLGRMLAGLEVLWIESSFSLDRNALLSVACGDGCLARDSHPPAREGGAGSMIAT